MPLNLSSAKGKQELALQLELSAEMGMGAFLPFIHLLLLHKAK